MTDDHTSGGPYGRWTQEGPEQPAGDAASGLALACLLYAINERSSGARPRPTAAVLTISRPDGAVIGHLAADAEDVAALTDRLHTLSDDRYGYLHAGDLARLLAPYAPQADPLA